MKLINLLFFYEFQFQRFQKCTFSTPTVESFSRKLYNSYGNVAEWMDDSFTVSKSLYDEVDLRNSCLLGVYVIKNR